MRIKQESPDYARNDGLVCQADANHTGSSEDGPDQFLTPIFFTQSQRSEYNRKNDTHFPDSGHIAHPGHLQREQHHLISADAHLCAVMTVNGLEK